MSTPTPDILRELHRLRRHLRDLQGEIDQGPRVAAARLRQLQADEQAHRDAHEAIKRLKLKQKDDEGSLKQTEQRLAKLQADLNTAGSKKEFDAKSSEIEQATAKKGELEDAILAALTELEERAADLPNVEAAWAAAQAAFAQAEADGRARLDRLKADQVASQGSLAEWEAKLPAAVKPMYDRLVKSHGADGLAGVRGRSCQQCRTSITDQQRMSIYSGVFLCCPNCGRGLYLVD